MQQHSIRHNGTVRQVKRQTAKSSKKTKSKYYDLQFVFRYANVDVKIDSESYDEDSQKKIKQIVRHAS